MKGGANWFYWIAGLSLFNSVGFAAGATVSFLGGLGFAVLVDVFINAMIENGASPMLKIVSVVFALILIIAFALFGYYANRGFSGAFILGIIIYSLDLLLVLLLEDYFMAGFHALALFFIVRGYLACRRLRATPVGPPASL